MNKFKDYINNKEEQLISVSKNGNNIQYIKNPDKDIILYMISHKIIDFNYFSPISIADQEYLINKIPNLLLSYPDKFNKSLKLKYQHLLVPGKLGIFDNE